MKYICRTKPKIMKNKMIGKVDVNDCQLREGGRIEIEICKASANNAHGVVKTGTIIYSIPHMAYCLREEGGQVNPLCNFAPRCEFKKL